jgi:hypothetical protein
MYITRWPASVISHYPQLQQHGVSLVGSSSWMLTVRQHLGSVRCDQAGPQEGCNR